jgi:hypothetical protein
MTQQRLSQTRELIRTTNEQAIVYEDLNQLEILKINTRTIESITRLLKERGFKEKGPKEKEFKDAARQLDMHLLQRKNYLLVVDVASYDHNRDALQLGFKTAKNEDGDAIEHIYEIVVKKGNYRIGEILPNLPQSAELLLDFENKSVKNKPVAKKAMAA